jgi:hypothetical protein
MAGPGFFYALGSARKKLQPKDENADPAGQVTRSDK